MAQPHRRSCRLYRPSWFLHDHAIGIIGIHQWSAEATRVTASESPEDGALLVECTDRIATLDALIHYGERESRGELVLIQATTFLVLKVSMNAAERAIPFAMASVIT